MMNKKTIKELAKKMADQLTKTEIYNLSEALKMEYLLRHLKEVEQKKVKKS